MDDVVNIMLTDFTSQDLLHKPYLDWDDLEAILVQK